MLAGMDTTRPDASLLPLTRLIAAGCLACVLAMGAIAVSMRVSQEEFEAVWPALDYAARLREVEPLLRVVMAIDTLFLALYSAFFVLFPYVHREGAVTLLARLGAAAMLATAVLDMVEDHHILAMARTAALGAPVDLASIAWQQAESQVKFNVSYVGLLLLGLGLPRRDALERGFALSIALPLPLLGALMWAAPPSWSPMLSLVRLLFFVGGFAGALVVLSRRR